MNQNSSVTTAGVTFTAATIVPVVTWVLNGCRDPIPETVPYLIAAALVTVAHLAINLANNWIAGKSKSADAPAVPDQPAVQPTDKATS